MSDTKDDGSSEEMGGITPVGGYGSYVPIKKPVPADFQKWARRDFWHIAEATMLLLGFEPFKVTAHYWPKPEGFDDIYEAACRSSALRGRSPTPRHLLAWAREMEYRIPEELEEAVNRFQPKAEGSPQGGAEGHAMDVHTKVPLPRQKSGLIRFGDIGEMIAAVMYPPTQAVKRRYVWRDERYFSQDDIGEKEITDKPTIRDLDNVKAERERGGVLDRDDRGQVVIGEEADDSDIGRDIHFLVCVEGYSKALERAVENGDLAPLDPLTLLSHPFPFGQALKNSLVALGDLKRWGESVGIAFVASEGPPENETVDERRATSDPASGIFAGIANKRWGEAQQKREPVLVKAESVARERWMHSDDDHAKMTRWLQNEYSPDQNTLPFMDDKLTKHLLKRMANVAREIGKPVRGEKKSPG